MHRWWYATGSHSCLGPQHARAKGEQKKALSFAIVAQLKALLPGGQVISMTVMEFEKATCTDPTIV